MRPNSCKPLRDVFAMMPADLTFVGLRPLGKLMVSDSGGESESHGKYIAASWENVPRA